MDELTVPEFLNEFLNCFKNGELTGIEINGRFFEIKTDYKNNSVSVIETD